jgi:hypothetical protein
MFVVLNNKDNIGIFLGRKRNLIINNKKINISLSTKYGHKFALKNIKKNQAIIKYGEKIGKAYKHIKIGEHVHIQNLK